MHFKRGHRAKSKLTDARELLAIVAGERNGGKCNQLSRHRWDAVRCRLGSLFVRPLPATLRRLVPSFSAH
ncbi:hypothetical protein RISK_005536 [Rhodopirellula islandica]|uniref:Uncharacterized protein n=1 Tax=Rhodopirellula islandica TaxID=595434 RepID=A0A0J1B6N2_RHOIS|nr:hypothetical protein RISK_005536 [Rhodopirellula islandica]